MPFLFQLSNSASPSANNARNKYKHLTIFVPHNTGLTGFPTHSYGKAILETAAIATRYALNNFYNCLNGTQYAMYIRAGAFDSKICCSFVNLSSEKYHV